MIREVVEREGLSPENGEKDGVKALGSLPFAGGGADGKTGSAGRGKGKPRGKRKNEGLGMGLGGGGGEGRAKKLFFRSRE